MKTQLEIGGTSCAMCVGHATKALQNVPQVREVYVQFEAPNATIEHDGASLEALISAVEAEGYAAKLAM